MRTTSFEELPSGGLTQRRPAIEKSSSAGKAKPPPETVSNTETMHGGHDTRFRAFIQNGLAFNPVAFRRQGQRHDRQTICELSIDPNAPLA